MWPAIFLPFQTRPGSWQAPVEPRARCVADTPCVARIPLKPCRFMPPWKPLPLEMPHTSTSCPGTKCPAPMTVPTGSSAEGSTRNSMSLRLGVTPAALKCPLSGLVTFLALASATPSCIAVYPCFGASFTCVTTHPSTCSEGGGGVLRRKRGKGERELRRVSNSVRELYCLQPYKRRMRSATESKRDA